MAASPRLAETSALARELAGKIEGEVRFDAGSRALYSHDLSIYRQVPIGVVLPRHADDVVATLEACRRHGAPVLPRGGGTSLVGQCTNVAVVLDFSKYMNRILEVDVERKLARVEPGVVCDQLKAEVEEHGLTFGPDPATHAYCTFGGMVGNNSCGVHSLLTEFHGQGSRTSDHVEELEVVTYDGLRLRVGAATDDEVESIVGQGGRRGELYARLRDVRDRHGDAVRERFPDIPRRVSGLNLDDLLPERGFHVARALAGSEGTCAVTLEATVALADWPPARVLVVVAYADRFAAADAVPAVRAHRPIGLEGFDSSVTQTMAGLDKFARERALLPDGAAWLLVEFGGETPEEAEGRAADLVRELGRGTTYGDDVRQSMVWLVRENALGASRIPGKFETWPSFEDSAVHPDQLGAYLRDFDRLLERHGYRCVYYGHFGQGCLHCRIDFDLGTTDGLRVFRRFLDEASDLVLSHGGSLSGEHGDGQAHAHHLERMYGPELVEGFREFKRAWDPDWKLNPGKLVDAYEVDENLRVGPDYRRRRVKTHFSFAADGGSLAAATERCFGAGRCRRLGGGTMCPSFMVTKEERHTTRGRAHLLFELLRGETIGENGWRDEHVKEALDLCLACKGCKADCPVGVDLATYKAEFLAHYYARGRRPAAAYALGLVDRWARLGSRAPALVNAATAFPPLAAALKRAAGLAPERELPKLASPTFSAWFHARTPRRGGERVLLWPDTFSNYLAPDPAKAAVEVLEAAGFEVAVPSRPLCCGRPLYDFGMLDRAKRYLRDVLDALAGELGAGTPIVVLEPSCAAVFADELGNLFPDDERAGRLASAVRLLPAFVGEHVDRFPLGALPGSALVHGHCHQKALFGLEAEAAALTHAGVRHELLDAGCCGLAGSFGYHHGEHYDVSMRIGERVLFPAVRAAPDDAFVVADGFSCRQQIAHGTGRRAMHVAELLRLALVQEEG